MDYNDELQTYNKIDKDKLDKIDRQRFEFIAQKYGAKKAREMLEKYEMKNNENIEDEDIEVQKDEDEEETEEFQDDSEEIMEKAKEIENSDKPHHYKSHNKKPIQTEEQDESEQTDDDDSNYKHDKPEDLVSTRSIKKLALLTQSIKDLQGMVSIFKDKNYKFPLTVRNEVSRNLMKSTNKLLKLHKKYSKKYHNGKDFSEEPISDDHLLSYFATRLEELDV